MKMLLPQERSLLNEAAQQVERYCTDDEDTVYVNLQSEGRCCIVIVDDEEHWNITDTGAKALRIAALIDTLI